MEVTIISRYISRTPRESKLDEGEHPATISKIEDEDDVETQYGIKDRYIITFDVEGDGSSIEIRKRYTKSMFPKSNLFKLISILAGDDFDGQGYDVDELVGKRCRVVVTHRTNEETNDVWEQIETVLRPRAKQASSLDELAAMQDLSD
jgi:hypothetical protein